MPSTSDATGATSMQGALSFNQGLTLPGNMMPQLDPPPPEVIPENPTNREIFELMTKTETRLMSQMNGFRVAAEKRFTSLEGKASNALEMTGVLNVNVDKNTSNIAQLGSKMSSITEDNVKLNGLLKTAMTRLTEIEGNVNDLDREGRRKNVRLLNVPEDKDEDCILKVANMIKNNSLGAQAQELPLNEIVKSVENAHRIGKVLDGRNRHMLVKFQSGPLRDDVMRTHKSRGKRTKEGYDMKDDYSKTDKKTHGRYAPYLKRIFELDGTKVFFKHGNFRHKGVWYAAEEFDNILLNYGINLQSGGV